MRLLAATLICAVLAGASAASPPPEEADFFSFEQPWEGWSASGTDLQTGSGANVPWSISLGQEMAKKGTSSVKLFLDNINDAGKIWIQRPFVLHSNETYQVRVSYLLAGPDGIGVIIAGALTDPPATDTDLAPAFEDTMTRGPNRWTKKQYEFTAQTDSNGMLFVVIGIWGAFEGPMTYYVDVVRTTFTMRQTGALEPVIQSAGLIGKKLIIRGLAFGPSPRVIIDNVDCSEFITVSSDTLIKLRIPSDISVRSLRVVDDTTAAASAPFSLQ